jgi:F-box/leucine-rich repeat protein 2/20
MINDPHVNINQIILKQRLSIYNKTQSSFKLCFNHGIPSDVFQGEEWDASPWTQVATDEAIVAMIHENGFKSPVILNLSGAVDITDVALQSLARVSGKLQLINLQSVSKISEKGIHPVFVNSRVIQSLNLSGCIGIAGSAFALVGQYCKTLKELNVSRCHQITSWAFTKIFEGCNDLRIFDCSFNLQLMDNELRILGHYSKCLESVNLAECIHVSDIGVAFIADGCRFLRSINLSRTDLVMKISDISLLSLSDNCHELVFIDLTGCQNVTDTGIAWLFSGCKKLQHLGLSNCRKVTNRALRYIGECMSLMI